MWLKTRFVEKTALRQKSFEVSFPSDTQKRTDDMDPLYCIANEGEFAKESLSRIKTRVFIKVQ